MISTSAIRGMYKELGPWGFVQKWNRMLGLPGPNSGEREWDANRRKQARESAASERVINPGDVSIKALAQALVSPYDEELKSQLAFGSEASFRVPLHAMENFCASMTLAMFERASSV